MHLSLLHIMQVELILAGMCWVLRFYLVGSIISIFMFIFHIFTYTMTIRIWYVPFINRQHNNHCPKT